MSGVRDIVIALGDKLLKAILANRFKHGETRSFHFMLAALWQKENEALVDERAKQIHVRDHLPKTFAGDGKCSFKRESAYEYGKASEQRAFVLAEEVVAPGDRVAHRLQSFRLIARAAR